MLHLNKIKNKALLCVIILGMFAVVFGLFYNGARTGLMKEEARAQGEAEEVELVCGFSQMDFLPGPLEAKLGDEIPLGQLIDEVSKNGVSNFGELKSVMALATEQINLAREVVDLADDCDVENCRADCHEDCSDTDGDGEDECHCDEPSSCSDKDDRTSPCPPEIQTKVLQIETLYNQVSSSKQVINNNLDKRDSFIEVLEKIRVQLSYCVTPSEQEISELEADEVRVLFTCQEAQYENALPSDVEDCYPNNLICCYFKGL